MRQGGGPEAISTEDKFERLPSSGVLGENGGTPWLLEWFPGFDIPIGLEGRAYLRRLLNHRRAENPAACETLLAAHGIKLGRGVPGHTSNWGSMKVRELLHAAYLLGCWSAVEKLCINFCHANGLKTEWIRELKAKGGKQCVTLANLQNYRKKNREKKRPQPAESREKKTSFVAAVLAIAPVAASTSHCLEAAASSLANTSVPLDTVGDVSGGCDQVEGDNEDDISCSPATLKASKRSRRNSAFSCDQQAPSPYVSTLQLSQQAALSESAPHSDFNYAPPIPPFLSNEARNDVLKHELTNQQTTRDISDTQLSVQLALPLLQSAPTDPDGIANTGTQNIVAVPASEAFDRVSTFTYMLEEVATKSSSVTPCSSTSVTRVRRPKRRSGKARRSGPRKRRQVSARKSLAGAVRADSFSSVTSSEYPPVHVSKSVARVPVGQIQSDETKLMGRTDVVPASQQAVASNASDITANNQSFFITSSAQESSSTAAQRTVTTTTIPAPSAGPLAARAVAGPLQNTVHSSHNSPQCCHKWLNASLFCTESSDNGSSETESLRSRTSTCTTTSSNSDSDHSFPEGCQCSFFKAKQVNFAGKKPAFTCFQAPCPHAEVTEAPLSVFVTARPGKEPPLESTDVSSAPAWARVAAAPQEFSGLLKGDLFSDRDSHPPNNFFQESVNIAVGAAAEKYGNSVSVAEGSTTGTPRFWSATHTPATAAVAGQAPQELCTPITFCGDVDASTAHFPPQITAFIGFDASFYKPESEKVGATECGSAAEREDPLTRWSPQDGLSVAGADFATPHIGSGERSPFIRGEKGPVQITSELHKHTEGGHFASERYTHHSCSRDLPRDVKCETDTYSDGADTGPANPAGESTLARDRVIHSPFQDEQYRILQQRAEERGENSSFPGPSQFSVFDKEAVDTGGTHFSLSNQHDKPAQNEAGDTVVGNHMISVADLSNGQHGAMWLKGGDCPGERNPFQRTVSSSSENCELQISDITEECVRGDPPVNGRIGTYGGNLLSSPLPCTEVVASTLSLGDRVQCQTLNMTGTHRLDTRSGSTETSYSTPQIPAKDTWEYYSTEKVGDYHTWGDVVGAEKQSQSVMLSTASDFDTPLLSPRSAALTGRSTAAVVTLDVEEAYTVSRHRTAEICFMEGGPVPLNPLPLQLPPLAEPQDLFIPSDISTAEGCETQKAVWGKSSACASISRSNMTAAAVAPRTTTAAEALGNDSTTSPLGSLRTATHPTEWFEPVQSAEDCCAGNRITHALTENEHRASGLKASYKINCGPSHNSALDYGTTVHLTIRGSAAQ